MSEAAEIVEWTEAETKAFLKEHLPPCLTLMGGEFVDSDQAEWPSRIDFELDERFCHSKVIVQGGYITGMMDGAMSHAVLIDTRFQMSPPTLELKVSFLNAGNPGKFRAYGRIRHRGKSIAFLEGRLENAEGKVIAVATSTARLVPNTRLER